MKKLSVSALLIVAAMIITGPSAAQQPEKVYSIVKQIKPFEWYQEQAAAWKNVLDKEPANGPAWQYYFTANRMARMTNPARWEAAKGKVFRDPEEIVEAAGKASPGSFEALYIKLWNRNGEYPDYKKDLFRAYELCNDRAEIMDDMAMYYEVTRNHEKRKEINKQWFTTNDIPAGILNYNYNVLLTLDDNAIIITGGDNDTFPMWMLQDVMGVKPGVTVLNIYLLTKPDYRKRVFAELNIPELPINQADDNGGDSLATLRKTILSQITEKAKRPVYLAVTLDSKIYVDTPVEKDIYLTGLAMRYHTQEFDNIAVIRRHFENDYLLDYLLAAFSEDPSAQVVAQMNTGYLPALVKLCSHYRSSGESEKLARVKKLMQGIAASNGNREEMRPYINCE